MSQQAEKILTFLQRNKKHFIFSLIGGISIVATMGYFFQKEEVALSEAYQHSTSMDEKKWEKVFEKTQDANLIKLFLARDKQKAMPFIQRYLNKLDAYAPLHAAFFRVSLLEDDQKALEAITAVEKKVQEHKEGQEALYGYILLEKAVRYHHLSQFSEEKESLGEFLSWSEKHPELFSHRHKQGSHQVSLMDYFNHRLAF
jgi:hypothetical protein